MDIDVNGDLFTHLDYLPDGFLQTDHRALHTILSGPTLIELPGINPKPLFVSILLHGNECTGLQAIQAVLKNYAGKPLPRALALFIGNVQAAQYDLRRLDGQPDYNRIWPGADLPPSPETQMAEAIVALMRQRDLFASVDIHNNTGLNPHYSCVNSLDNAFLQLATLFGRLVVYFTHPKGVQSAAFARLCPAVTLECGQPDRKQGIDHALEFLESCLHLTEFPKQPVHPQDIDLFHTVAQVKVAEGISFGFEQANLELSLDKSIERFNFTEVDAGTVLATTTAAKALPLIASDVNGEDVTGDYFSRKGSHLLFAKPAMPSMLTLNERIIAQDCLCYLMERIPLLSGQ
ncbi:MAG: peptidase M14 [Methylobacter sp.]|nr:MAG: peptidase M14 [Methylobacter sp.]